MGERLLAFQHALNPLHIYCRLLDKGISRGFSGATCRIYEVLIFTWLNWTLKSLMYFTNVKIGIHGSRPLS